MAVETMVPVRDVVEAAPEMYKVLLENDRVRVLDIRMKPGEHSPVRSRPQQVVYALADATVRFDYPDGVSETVHVTPGQALWQDPATYVAHNIGDTEVHSINVELKD